MKRTLAVGLVGASLAGLVVMATGGTAIDPFVSQSYLESTYSAEVLAKVSGTALAELEKLYQNASGALSHITEYVDMEVARLSQGAGVTSQGMSDFRVKQGDVVYFTTGTTMMVLAGDATMSYGGTAVLDLTNGVEVPRGSLACMARYMAGEMTSVAVTITSPTAVIAVQGEYHFSASDGVDYNAIADGLKELGLLKGSDTAYGSGYDLESGLNRIESLILFLRLMGEETLALATEAVCPFVDVADWAKPYVAYAYEKGYTKGVDMEAMLFDPTGIASGEAYLTFVLRALGYEDGRDFNWGTTLSDANQLGVISDREVTLLMEPTFYRSYSAYLSYVALDMERAGGGTLLEYLVEHEIFDPKDVQAVRENVNISLLS